MSKDIDLNLSPLASPLFATPERTAKSVSDYTKCGLCLNSGIIQAVLKKKPGGPTIFICQCARGAADHRNYPRWHAMLARDYEVCT